MDLPHYSYKINNNFLDYEFTSVGPKGQIKKVVRFTLVALNTFNLAFGDLDEETGEIDDITVSNNKDTQKILATVAYAVHDFTLQYDKIWVIAIGSTISRTRLYRMSITNYWKEINDEFEVLGLRNGDWVSFKSQNNYDAFLIQRR